MVWVVVVGGYQEAHWAQTMALGLKDWVVEDHFDLLGKDVVMMVERQTTPRV